MKENEIRQKAEALAVKLTLEEKIGMIHGAHLFSTKGVERLGIPPLVMSDGPMGVRQEFEPDHWKAIGNSDDYVTYLPCNSALAATWNRNLAFALGSVLGEEARGRGKDVILAPGINIKRSPLCGRNFEYFSEDPYLTGEMAVPFIQGVQQWDVAACVKHFAANNQETQRLWVNVEIDEDALREIYLPAFYDCLIRGKSLAVMGAYNKLYSEHCCQSQYLLHDILRREWNYDGVVISDWGGVHDTVSAALSELDIEMSVTDNFDDYFMAEPLREAVEQGKVPEEKIEEKIVRILMLMMRLHMIGEEECRRRSGAYNLPQHRQAALEAARESLVLLKNEGGQLPLNAGKMKKILVVGENADRIHSGGGGSAEIKALYEISPLMGIRMLLGGNVQVDYVKGYESGSREAEADTNWQEKSLEDGGGHGLCEEEQSREMCQREEQNEEDGVCRKEGQNEGDGVCQREGQNEEDGACQREGQNEGDGVCRKAAQSGKGQRHTGEALRREAVEAAGEYDKVIFIGGLNHDYDSEGLDRSSMKLPYGQDALIQELLAVRPDTVLVFVGGSAVEMGEWIDRAAAVMWCYYAGMEGGTALAEAIFGRINPSGKLPETFYKRHTDCSAHRLGEFGEKENVVYGEGIFVGYRYNETFGVEPEFCFGHGLSYTDFVYEDAVYEETDGGGNVVCRLRNAGSYAGGETVQVYWIREQNGENPHGAQRQDVTGQCSAGKGYNLSVFRPLKELAGFGKIYLEPGETGQVEISVKGRRDGYRLGVGASVRDIRISDVPSLA